MNGFITISLPLASTAYLKFGVDFHAPFHMSDTLLLEVSALASTVALEPHCVVDLGEDKRGLRSNTSRRDLCLKGELESRLSRVSCSFAVWPLSSLIRFSIKVFERQYC